MLSQLSQGSGKNVGGSNGISDRQIVADTFLAKTESGVIPAFATADAGIYRPLAKIEGISVPDNVKEKDYILQSYYPDGFNVTIDGKTIKVIPIPDK